MRLCTAPLLVGAEHGAAGRAHRGLQKTHRRLDVGFGRWSERGRSMHTRPVASTILTFALPADLVVLISCPPGSRVATEKRAVLRAEGGLRRLLGRDCWRCRAAAQLALDPRAARPVRTTMPMSSAASFGVTREAAR